MTCTRPCTRLAWGALPTTVAATAAALAVLSSVMVLPLLTAV